MLESSLAQLGEKGATVRTLDCLSGSPDLGHGAQKRGHSLDTNAGLKEQWAWFQALSLWVSVSYLRKEEAGLS